MILLVNTKLTKPRVRGKTRRKTSLYSKLEKASMLIGTAGLLGGVIGPRSSIRIHNSFNDVLPRGISFYYFIFVINI